MNPQLNKVFSKLAKEDKKTELASEKVELGLVQDIQKVITNAKAKIKDVAAAQKRYNAALKEVEEAESKALDVREEGVDVFQRGGAIREDALDAAKDLGLDAKGIKGFAELDKILDVLNKDYQNLLRSIK